MLRMLHKHLKILLRYSHWVCAPGIMPCESMAFQTYGASSLMMEVWCIPKMPRFCSLQTWIDAIAVDATGAAWWPQGWWPNRQAGGRRLNIASFVLRQSTTWHHWAGSNQRLDKYAEWPVLSRSSDVLRTNHTIRCFEPTAVCAKWNSRFHRCYKSKIDFYLRI